MLCFYAFAKGNSSWGAYFDRKVFVSSISSTRELKSSSFFMISHSTFSFPSKHLTLNFHRIISPIDNASVLVCFRRGIYFLIFDGIAIQGITNKSSKQNNRTRFVYFEFRYFASFCVLVRKGMAMMFSKGIILCRSVILFAIVYNLLKWVYLSCRDARNFILKPVKYKSNRLILDIQLTII